MTVSPAADLDSARSEHPSASRGWFDPTDGPVKAFTESILLGVLWFVLSVPIVSVGPATITVLAISRRQQQGHKTNVQAGWKLFRSSWRVGGALSVAVVLAGSVILMEVHVATVGALPGGVLMGRALIVALVGLLGGLLTIAAVHVSSGAGLRRSAAAAFELCITWPARSLGLFGGVAAIALLCWAQPALICFAVGPLLYAADVVVATTCRGADASTNR